MKKIFKTIFFFVSFLLILQSCGDKNLIEVSLDKTVLELEIGETYILQAYTIPKNSSQTIEWTSSNPQVATVLRGIITAESEGSATIVATIGGQSASCLIIVSNGNRNQKPAEDVSSAIRLLPKSLKRGVSFSFSIQDDVELLSPGVSWSYNWGPSPASIFEEKFQQKNMDFYPMAWNGGFNADNIRAYKQRNPSCNYILAFNEPNLTDQCNYTPEQAAEQWPRLKALADELNMKLISPAMNYGTLSGYSDPIKWLDEFFKLVPLSDIDGIAIHSYMSNAGGVKSYIDRYKKYGKPIWMTEFCAWDGGVTLKSQMNYMCEIINYMEVDPDVERYAWFIPRASGNVDTYPYMQLLTKSQPFELTELGRVFVGLSSQNKSIWQSTENHILAQTYSNISTSESLTGNFVGGPHLRPTTDATGDLELCDFFNNNWVEYQINAKQALKKIRLRYSNYGKSDCELWIDGNFASDIELPSTSDPSVWNTIESDLNLSSGNHIIRIIIKQGNICLNWLNFK